jgi:hypothetical protein
MKTIRYSVPQAFIDQREERKLKYNSRDRDDRQHRMDIDAELYEWYYLNHMGFRDDERWEIDMISPENDRIDCKNITKWYNISQYKMCYLLRQHEITTHFEFWEWVDKPGRPLETDDMVQMRKLCRVPYWDVMKNCQPSKFNGGYYVDIRKHFV